MMDDQIKGVASEAYGRVQDAAGALAGDPGLQAEGKVNQAKGAVQQAYGKAKDKAGEVAHQAKDKAQDALGEVEDQVRANPLLAVGVSVGIGLLLGVLIGASGSRTIYVNGPRWPSRS